eukprot:gene15519-18392_t
MKMVEDGILGDIKMTKLNMLLDFWPTDEADVRSGITLYHLLSQTSGIDHNILVGPFGGLNTVEVAYIIAADYPENNQAPGVHFKYSETNFILLGAAAVAATGAESWNSLFRHHIADPLGLSDACNFAWPIGDPVNHPGAFAVCSSDDYSKFLTAVYNTQIVSNTTREEMERPHTLLQGSTGTAVTGALSNYALGAWRQCESEDCTSETGVTVHSMGYGGVFPWVHRSKNTTRSHWGLIFRNVTGSMAPSIRIQEAVLLGLGEKDTTANQPSASCASKCQAETNQAGFTCEDMALLGQPYPPTPGLWSDPAKQDTFKGCGCSCIESDFHGEPRFAYCSDL